jgi:hypothetical protein
MCVGEFINILISSNSARNKRLLGFENLPRKGRKQVTYWHDFPRGEEHFRKSQLAAYDGVGTYRSTSIGQ